MDGTKYPIVHKIVSQNKELIVSIVPIGLRNPIFYFLFHTKLISHFVWE